jgi:GNAT superfamily N-acetyltransferase
MMSSVQINVRPYTLQDRLACLAIFDGNTPDYFAPSERVEFAAFLDSGSADYLVLETAAGVIVGCGGYYVTSAAGIAGLAWGMVDRVWHKRGLGRVLLEARLAELRRFSDAKLVRVHTSQNSRGFFERCGFRAVRVVPDGFAPGIDRVESELALR